MTIMKTKDNKKTGTSPVRDICFIHEKPRQAIERLQVVIAQKEQYLRRRPSPFIQDQLQVLYAVVVDIAEGMKDCTVAYNELASAYTLSLYEINALRFALPENRSSLCLGREVYALRHQVKHKRMPDCRVPDRIREKAERFEKRMAQEKTVHNG